MSRSWWVGWTGLGWATPCGGQARIRSHRPLKGWWVGSTGHYWDIAWWRVSRMLGQTPPTISSRLQVFEDLAGNVAFQAAHDLWGVQSFGSAARHVAAGLGVVAHAGEHDAIQRGVGLAVAAAVEPIPAAGLAGAGGQRSDATQMRPRAFRVQPVRVVSGGDEQRCGAVEADAVELE